MTVDRRGRLRILMLGPSDGWHVDQLRDACNRQHCELSTASYESMTASIESQNKLKCGSNDFSRFDGVLTRTMPAASMEHLTFRLAVLHGIADGVTGVRIPIVNPPRALEWAIDKFATLARISAAGFPVPRTAVVQSRRDAMDAFQTLGGDCIVKPIFGGEGRGVMRVNDRDLAWTCFSTLEQLQSAILIQEFVPPGGHDTRLLVIGDRILAIRRTNENHFRTNVSSGAKCEAISCDQQLAAAALRIVRSLGLHVASVDIIDNDHGPPLFLEVNAIPGWKGAQSVVGECIADLVVNCLRELSDHSKR